MARRSRRTRRSPSRRRRVTICRTVSRKQARKMVTKMARALKSKRRGAATIRFGALCVK